MVPAMDRRLKTRVGRSWAALGLGLAVGVVDLGCSNLPWRKPKPEPAELGRVSDTTDIYAMHRPAEPSTAVPESLPIVNITPGASGTSSPSEVGEVGMAVRPAEVVVDPSANGVALQPPTAMESAPASSPRNALNGVPNASLILASSERRTVASATVSPLDLVAEARSALNSMANYEVSLHRQERVNGTLLPEEDVVVSIRRDPRAVRLTWPEGPNHGREVLYRSDEPGGPMHVKMANPALPRLSLPPESPMVMKNSRHPVTEAGLDSIVEGLENAVKAPEQSGIRYAGLETVDGIDQPQHCLLQDSPTGDRWRIYLDPTSHLPSLVEAKDASGELLERYLFRDVRPNLPELATSEAFDANARWGKPAGLFGRLARGESTETPPSTTPR